MKLTTQNEKNVISNLSLYGENGSTIQIKQTLLSRQDLAKRWGFTDTKVIQTYENNGIIKRVPGISVPRYSIIQIEELETAGLDLDPLSPVERRRLERRIEELEMEIEIYKTKIINAKIILD